MISCAPKREIYRPSELVYDKPVKGKVVKERKRVFIKTSCDKFVRAVETGRVEYSGRGIKAFGWTVIIKQRDGYYSVYANLDRPFVRAGDVVKRRQVIAKVGEKRGRCGIFFEVRDRRGRITRFKFR